MPAEISKTLLKNNQKLIATLVDQGYLEENITESLTSESFNFETDAVTEYLLENRIITKDLLGQAIAESSDLPYADLNSNFPDLAWQEVLPEHIREQYKLVVFSISDSEVNLTTSEPELLMADLQQEYVDPELVVISESFITRIKNKFSKKAADSETPTVSLQQTLQHLFEGKDLLLSYSLPEDIKQVVIASRESLDSRFQSILQNSSDQMAINLLDEIIAEALIKRASDIHFDIKAESAIVRFRVDGILHQVTTLPISTYESLLNRLKVQSNLRIDEHQEPQDGAIRYISNDKEVDLRLSIIPTMNGEKAEMRILSSYLQKLTLNDLGLSDEHQELLQAEINKPYGMVLVTGPTGSGKTTSLYSAVKLLNTPERNITTIEDPVEYRIDGINQIQVNKNTNLGFSTGLRSIMRQDPDVILVGEIRDEETASIAVNAALTGHLLFSTFHANDATSAIPRLLDMKIESYLLASTLNIIIAQRLVRKLCLGCTYSKEYSYQDLANTLPNPEKFYKVSKTGNTKVRLYESKGCGSCNGLGYSGRLGLFEILQITPELEDLIVGNPSSKEIYDLARKSGMKTMFEDGVNKTLQGVTTLSEILRVAQPPTDE